ncbi:MAG: DUF1592 domain-containing protein [Planctomycetota bacterium]
MLSDIAKSKCYDCHSGEDAAGGITLSQESIETLFDGTESSLETVLRITNVIENGEMPPEGEPEIASEPKRELIAQLNTWFKEAVASGASHPSTPIRRMNRFQYNNAVVDLFDLRCIVFTLPERMMREHRGYFRPESGKMAEVVHVGSRPLGKSQMIEPRLAGVAAFPQDLRAEHGFDNRADHLSLSPLLMESFLKLGQSITSSPDFTPKRVGIWNDFFKAPTQRHQWEDAIDDRLENFLHRAFRGRTDAVVSNRYAAFAKSRIDSGDSFEEAMKTVAGAVIASPRFLYLYQPGQFDDTESTLPMNEIASRLSFFLWGSLPDQRLLEASSNGSLNDVDAVSREVDRMLNDRKLKRFCDSFASQWLQLDRIISSVPDRSKFPEFYYSKYRNSMHMMMEPLLVFETVLIENKPITQLIDSDFTYRSGQLQKAYKDLALPTEKNLKKGEVASLQFHRLPVADKRSGGVITNAAVMTMTSGPERTQPITRGAWIASVVFNDPPEPPPADVPPLGEKPAEAEEHLTLRERLSLHRERSDCRGCHEQIDPLGFALENYGATGTWRRSYENGREIDISGRLFRQRDFGTVDEFKEAILDHPDRFTRALAGHLLSFALARELVAADESSLDRIVEQTAADEYRFKTLIREVVLSESFRGGLQFKTNEQDKGDDSNDRVAKLTRDIEVP